MRKRWNQLGAIMAAAMMMMSACGTTQNAETTTVEMSTAEASAEVGTTAGETGQAEETAPEIPSETQAVSEEDTWDLTEYFTDEAAFEQEISAIRDKEFPILKDKIEKVVDPETLLDVFQYEDALSIRLNHLCNYAIQKTDLNASDSVALKQKNTATLLYQDHDLLITNLNNRLVAMEESFWNKVLEDPALEPYYRQLIRLKKNAQHLLSDEQEKLLQPLYQAQINVQDAANTLNNVDMEYKAIKDPQGQEVTANYNNYRVAMENPDRDYRREYHEAFIGRYQVYRNTFAQNLNAYTTMSEQLARLHHYDSVLDSAMTTDELSEEIYDALLKGAAENVDVLKRENEIRRNFLGYDTLYSYDIRVPMGEAKAPTYTYEEAKKIVKEGLAPLGEDYLAVLDQAFENRWVDVYPAENKATGAYSGGSIDIHPWVLTNYADDYDSVSTLAHELGHAVHQYESEKTQKSDFAKNPTALVSEVASTANEQILSRYMIAHAKDEAEKLYYVQQELGMLHNTFFGQIQFAAFEKKFHEVVEAGDALTADQLDEMYLETTNTYSQGMKVPDYVASYWAAIPHFYYNYYVYSYAMDVAVSCQIAAAISEGDETMLQNYKEFLTAGDSASAPELFARLGVDVTKPDYIKPLIARYQELLDMEEELLDRM